jgi:predicted site-specific integrase-resolvase
MKHKPKSFITAEEAHSLLNVSRSTLSRYVKNGTITPFKVLMKDAKGTRLQHLFLKSEVRRLSYFLTAIRRRGNDDDQASE